MSACGSSGLRQTTTAAEQPNEASSSRAQAIGAARTVVLAAALLGLLAVVGFGSQEKIRGGSAPFLARQLGGSELEAEESSNANLAEDEEPRFLASKMEAEEEEEEDDDAVNLTFHSTSDGNASSLAPGSNVSVAAVAGAACAASGEDCHACECCSMVQESCFETQEGQARCMRSCTPGDGRSCRTPFAPWQAQARETYAWPDIVAVCAPGEALVRGAAFAATYEGSCDVYCRRGAGQAVAPEWAQLWVSVPVQGSGKLGHCLGEEADEAAPEGVSCFCSFPDRL